MICVLLLAAGGDWEGEAFGRLTAHDGVVVLKRCVDVEDLLATATTGQADVAVVGLDVPGLDPAAVVHLRRHAVRPVAVAGTALGPVDGPGLLARAAALDIATLVAQADLASLPQVVTTVEAADTRPSPSRVVVDEPPARHRVIAVWGPAGAPGRTTLAVTLAGELARRGPETVLVDADPYGGSVAQQLGILDEVSGLLSAARLAAAGTLGERFPSSCRLVGDHLRVVTGLPRGDRWSEVRGRALEAVVDEAAGVGRVVLDTGFSLEDDSGELGRPGRNELTLTALDLADEIVVVGSADPVGLSRLARGLVDLRERTGGAPVRVVVNRMRPTLGWSEREIAGMVEGFARVSGLHFLPEDRAAVDRALVSGRSVAEAEGGALAEAVAAVVDATFPDAARAAAAPGRRAGRRRRTAFRRTPRSG